MKGKAFKEVGEFSPEDIAIIAAEISGKGHPDQSLRKTFFIKVEDISSTINATINKITPPDLTVHDVFGYGAETTTIDTAPQEEVMKFIFQERNCTKQLPALSEKIKNPENLRIWSEYMLNWAKQINYTPEIDPQAVIIDLPQFLNTQISKENRPQVESFDKSETLKPHQIITLNSSNEYAYKKNPKQFHFTIKELPNLKDSQNNYCVTLKYDAFTGKFFTENSYSSLPKPRTTLLIGSHPSQIAQIETTPQNETTPSLTILEMNLLEEFRPKYGQKLLDYIASHKALQTVQNLTKNQLETLKTVDLSSNQEFARIFTKEQIKAFKEIQSLDETIFRLLNPHISAINNNSTVFRETTLLICDILPLIITAEFINTKNPSQPTANQIRVIKDASLIWINIDFLCTQDSPNLLRKLTNLFRR
jgi:hypothetical protein